jgi:hypothetical protein
MLLRDAITIPESVRQGDLVFKLSDAAEHARETVAQYVVTPQLESSFLDAVSLVKEAVTGGTSKAAYLSGSFGAGKSNFMGILQLLLDGNPDALAKPALAPVVARLGGWSEGKRFLTVPYHLIGASSLESAVLGGYVEHIREVHPDAPLPAVFADEPILALVDEFRTRLGDEAFFAGLGTSGGSSGWGDLDAPWDAARYDAARALPTSAPERRQLVQAALDTYAAAMADIARANRDGYVDIDSGLEAISTHAAELGYAGLILFLDELILWLMGRMADPEFVSAESAKISKLVEGSDDRRPAPVISVIARQRDLRELVGTDVPGLDRMGFIDNLKFQAGRFSDIRLDDSNLPAVAHERLLKPKDAAGAQALEDAFRSLSLTDEQRDALRGETGTDESFRLTYPFSPAFLTVVVDVAGALQRTRTGLRVLLDLLVRNRDTLEVGQLVPVGDLYDVLAASEEPLSDEMRATFESARDLYDHHLRPMLLAEHGLAPGDEPTSAFRTDDRLVKTLLLAALVPFSEPFKNLTARKLLALNHGLINSPVPGAEVGVVINKINTWATRPVGLQVGGDLQSPTVRVVLSGLDAAGILDAVAGVDNTGARRKLIKDLVCEGLEVPADQLIQATKVTWRGLERNVDLLFGNIRNADELPDSQFVPNGDSWKVVIDFPFDDEGADPNADFARVEALRDHGPSRKTVCWIPSHLTAEVRSQVGDLVRLNHLIPVPGQVSDRLREATQNLSAELREVARSQLEAMQRATRDRLRLVLKQAYGVATPDPGAIDTSLGLADHFPTLVGGLAIAPPVAPDLRGAFEAVLAQAMAHVFPAAPEIDGSVGRADLTTVLRVCTVAIEQPGRRIPQVETADRRVMARIANPLRLGVQAEQSFTLEGAAGHWDSHFTREIGKWREAGGEGNPTVADLRRWIDQPRPMGLSTEVQNLVVLVWALATDRTFLEHGGPARVEPGRLDDHLEVAAVDLPGEADWAVACERAEYVLGVASLPATASAVGLARLSNALASAVSDYAADADAAVTSLERLDALQPTTGDPARLRTARSAAQLIRSLGRAATDLDRVRVFLEAVLEPSAPAIGASLKASAAIVAAIGTADLAILKAAVRQPGATVGADLTALMETDELAEKFAPRLEEIYQRARALILGQPPMPPVPGPKVPVPPDGAGPTNGPDPQPPADVRVVLETTADRAEAIRRLAEVQQRLETEEGDGEYTIHVTFRPAPGTGT